MFRLTIRTILSHKRRLISTVVSIVLGVAFLAGTLVFTDSLRRSFDDLFSSVYSKTDAVVRSSEEISIGQGITQRGRIDESLVDLVAAVPGVTAASGSAAGYARILDHDGNPLGVDRGMPNFGMDISDNPLSVWDLRSGRLPSGSAEMAMDAGTFSQGDFVIGDQVSVVSQQGARTFELVGVVGFGDADSPVGSRVALFDLATAEEFVGQPGYVDSIQARGDGSMSQSELAARIAAVMPRGTETLTGVAMADDSSNQVKTALSFFNTLLLVFAVVALFVGSFIIYNTFSIIVAQRRKENALLRALGASERQIEVSMLGEAVVMGTLGSLLGFGAGFGMAVLLRNLLSAVGIDLPQSGLVLQPRTVVLSFVIGLGVTLVAALLPARRGAHVPPIAAMRDVAVEQPSFSSRRLAAGLGLLVAAVAAVAVGLTGQLLVLAVGVALVFVSMFVLGPLLARPVARFLGAPIARARGLSGSLARENAMRNPKRTARTAAALMVGVALVAAIAVFASSIKSSIRSVFDEQFTGDYVVSTQTFGFGGLPVALAPQLGEIPGVAAATGIQIGLARVDGKDQGVTVIDPATAAQVFDLGAKFGRVEDLDSTGILVSTARAEDDGLALGDELQLQFLDGGTHTVRVVGIYDRDELAGPYTIAKSLYAQSGGDQYDFSVYLTLQPGADTDAVEQALDAAVVDYPYARLESRTEYIESQAAQIDMFVNLVYGLLALAVIIAVLGIANALSLSVLERTRELGLLRAVGATRRQVRAMIRWESVITAVLGAVQGIVVGVALGWAVVRALRSQGFTEFSVPTPTLVAAVLIAIVCGVVAAARPARRAARLDILQAVASE